MFNLSRAVQPVCKQSCQEEELQGQAVEVD